MTRTPTEATEEAQRLARLRELVVLDSPPEPLFDAIAQLASDLFGTPIALLSLIDAERQWFKANVGLTGTTETPRDIAFCDHAIAADALLEVPDTLLDTRFEGNPLVRGAPGIRFYAGAPLVLPGGERVGTLCVIDRVPRRLSESQARTLQSLATVATRALVQRRDLIDRATAVRERYEHAARTSQAFLQRTGRVAGVGGWELDLSTSALVWSDETRRIHEVAPDFVPTLAAAINFYVPEARAAIETAVQVGMAQGTPWDLELPLITATGRRIWVRAVGEVEFEGGAAVRLIGAVQDITERKLLQQRVVESDRFVRRVTDSLPVRIAYVDSERRFRFVNQAHCERFGRSREDIIGRTRSELTGGTTDTAVEPHMAFVLQGQAQRFEFDDTVNGQVRRIESQLVPDLGEHGEVRGFFSTGVDITERSAAERSLRELTAIFENSTDYVVQTDWRGHFTYMNPAARHAIGLGAHDSVGHLTFEDFNTPATQRLFSEVITPAIKVHGVWVGEAAVYATGKREVPVSHMVLAHRGASGRIERYSAVMRDISTEVAARQALVQQATTLRAVTETIPALVAVVGADGCYRFVNSSFERWAGSPRDRIVGRTLLEVLGRAEYGYSQAWFERALAGDTITFDRSYPERQVPQHLSITCSPMWLPSGAVDGFISVAQDISQHRQEESRLRQLSLRDALTGLFNRAGFEQHLERQLGDGHGPQLGLLYIDLDRFKPVNDRHGHAVGDQVLKAFAQRIQKLVRPADVVARLGGDEFAVVLGGLRDINDAGTVASKVLEAAHAPFQVGGLRLDIGASVGIAFGADAQTGWPEFVARADALLYRAKQAGRGRAAGLAE